jgi:hypothetical protein
MFTVIVSNCCPRISGKMGFTIEDKALLINQLIRDFSRGRQPIKRLYDQAKKNVSIKQKIGLFSFWFVFFLITRYITSRSLQLYRNSLCRYLRGCLVILYFVTSRDTSYAITELIFSNVLVMCLFLWVEEFVIVNEWSLTKRSLQKLFKKKSTPHAWRGCKLFATRHEGR